MGFTAQFYVRISLSQSVSKLSSFTCGQMDGVLRAIASDAHLGLTAMSHGTIADIEIQLTSFEEAAVPLP